MLICKKEETEGNEEKTRRGLIKFRMTDIVQGGVFRIMNDEKCKKRKIYKKIEKSLSCGRRFFSF